LLIQFESTNVNPTAPVPQAHGAIYALGRPPNGVFATNLRNIQIVNYQQQFTFPQ
jgi:hypothetical protein